MIGFCGNPTKLGCSGGNSVSLNVIEPIHDLLESTVAGEKIISPYSGL
jgi:hypothetical protein